MQKERNVGKKKEPSGKLLFTYATPNPHNIWISKSVLLAGWNVLRVGSVLSLWALSEDDPGRHLLIPLQIILKDSVLSPRLFNMCLKSLVELICSFGAHLHLCAEEIQLYFFFPESLGVDISQISIGRD